MMIIMKKRSLWTPVAVLSGIITICLLAAGSDVFASLVRFIHADQITPFEALLCMIFTVAGFWLCYLLLNFLCGYFVPRLGAETRRQESNFTKSKKEGGEL